MPRGQGGAMSGIKNAAPVCVALVAPTNAAVLTSPDTTLFVADDADYDVLAATEQHETAGSDGSAVTADLKRCASGTAAASGTTVLASTFNLKSTAATPVTKSLSNGGIATATSRLTRGQSLKVDFTGTLTAVTGLCIQVWLRRVTPPRY